MNKEVVMAIQLRVKVFSRYVIFEGVHRNYWKNGEIFTVDTGSMVFSFPLEHGCRISMVPEEIAETVTIQTSHQSEQIPMFPEGQ